MVKSHSDRLLRYALKLTKNKSWSEDLVQESLIKLWTNKEKMTSDHAKAFLYKVLYNKMIDDQRKNSRMHQIADLPEISVQPTSLETTDLIEKAFEKLSVSQKQIIMLRDWDGFSYEEIADILELTLSTVKVQLFRARKKMKTILQSLTTEIKGCYEN